MTRNDVMWAALFVAFAWLAARALDRFERWWVKRGGYYVRAVTSRTREVRADGQLALQLDRQRTAHAECAQEDA